MNITSPILTGAANATELPSDSVSTFFRAFGAGSRRDLVKHGLAASAVLVLLTFVISDMRNAALAYLGLNPAKPAVEFEIRLPKAALATATDTQVELLTDRTRSLQRSSRRWPPAPTAAASCGEP